MSDDGSTAVEKKGRGRPKANGTQSVKFVLIYKLKASLIKKCLKLKSFYLYFFRKLKETRRSEADPLQLQLKLKNLKIPQMMNKHL